MADVRHYGQMEMHAIMKHPQSGQYMNFLEHIAVCNQCSALFAQYIEETSLCHASTALKASMKQEIREQSRRAPVIQMKDAYATTQFRKGDWKTGVKASQKKENLLQNRTVITKRQFIWYSTKVVMAAGIALMMLFGVDYGSLKKTPNVAAAVSSTIEQQEAAAEREAHREQMKESITESINSTIDAVTDFFTGGFGR